MAASCCTRRAADRGLVAMGWLTVQACSRSVGLCAARRRSTMNDGKKRSREEEQDSEEDYEVSQRTCRLASLFWILMVC